jgi:hypothetical protein
MMLKALWTNVSQALGTQTRSKLIYRLLEFYQLYAPRSLISLCLIRTHGSRNARRFIECVEKGSQSRFLMAKLNPSITQSTENTVPSKALTLTCEHYECSTYSTIHVYPCYSTHPTYPAKCVSYTHPAQPTSPTDSTKPTILPKLLIFLTGPTHLTIA